MGLCWMHVTEEGYTGSGGRGAPRLLGEYYINLERRSLMDGGFMQGVCVTLKLEETHK